MATVGIIRRWATITKEIIRKIVFKRRGPTQIRAIQTFEFDRGGLDRDNLLAGDCFYRIQSKDRVPIFRRQFNLFIRPNVIPGDSGIQIKRQLVIAIFNKLLRWLRLTSVTFVDMLAFPLKRFDWNRSSDLCDWGICDSYSAVSI